LTAASLRATDHLVTRRIEPELARESLPSATLLDPGPAQVTLAKAADRSVLGCMNGMALHCQYAVADYRSPQHTDIGKLNQSPLRNINGACGYRPPIEMVIERTRGR